MRPPELPVWIGGLTGGDYASCLAGFVNRHHLDGIQVIRGKTELPAEEAERTAHDVATHADARIFAERDHRAPLFEQRLKCLADGRARLDLDGAALRVVGDAFHR